jgi:uncharacterized protein
MLNTNAQPNQITIEQLWIYPVKSLAGICVTSAQLKTAGLKGDREWMVVDANGHFITQRQEPKLACIQALFIEEKIVLHHPLTGNMPLTSHENLSVPVKIFKDECWGFYAHQDVNLWLRETLKTTEEYSLVYFDKQQIRKTNAERFGDFYTYFSDGAPYLVVNLASLDALNNKLTHEGLPKAEIQRFRPNIVISGLPAFAEHSVTQIKHANGSILGLKDHCKRCSVITVDPQTGERSPDIFPFTTLTQLNSMPDNVKAPAFGVNTVLLTGERNVIACGEVCEVLS